MHAKSPLRILFQCQPNLKILDPRQQCSPQNPIQVQNVHQSKTIPTQKESRHQNPNPLESLLLSQTVQKKESTRCFRKEPSLLCTSSHHHPKVLPRILRPKIHHRLPCQKVRTQSPSQQKR